MTDSATDTATTDDVHISEICIVAIAEAFRGDGEVLCNPMGPVPVIAGRLARATFEPDLMLTDTIAYAVSDTLASAPRATSAGPDSSRRRPSRIRSSIWLAWTGLPSRRYSQPRGASSVNRSVCTRATAPGSLLRAILPGQIRRNMNHR